MEKLAVEIVKKHITIKELSKGYTDNSEDGVVGFDGKLDIRPAYQREFVYDEEKRNLVIDTVIKGFPLNIMYWNIKPNGLFEVLDGQQRTISICQYVNNNFSFEKKMFDRQPADIRKRILDYGIDIYQCTGTESERIEWFKVINIAGMVLKDQEILNAVYAGTWTKESKKIFSRTGCRAYKKANNYIDSSKSPIRQDYFELAIKWISNGDIEGYMDKHAKDTDCDELWLYWDNLFSWVETIFVNGDSDKRKQMKGVAWGELYNKFGKKKLNSKAIQKEVAKLMVDENEQITNLRGIYTYVLDGNEKHLNLRAFKDADKQKAYERQGGKCNLSGKVAPIEKMEADHKIPWSKGGKTDLDNCQMIMKNLNREKSAK